MPCEAKYNLSTVHNMIAHTYQKQVLPRIAVSSVELVSVVRCKFGADECSCKTANRCLNAPVGFRQVTLRLLGCNWSMIPENCALKSKLD